VRVLELWATTFDFAEIAALFLLGLLVPRYVPAVSGLVLLPLSRLKLAYGSEKVLMYLLSNRLRGLVSPL
jgi:hypothetical protein